MFEFAMVADAGGSLAISFSGTFTKTAAPSGGYVTSDTNTLSVSGFSSGQLTIRYGLTIGTIGGLEYSKNGAGFLAWADNSTVTFASGDTLAIRAGGAGGSAIAAGESQAFTLYDETTGITSVTYTITGS